MNKPFQNIVDAKRYNLMYSTGINIIACLIATHNQYGNKITEKQFDKMISILCNNEARSILSYRNDSQIIITICSNFPTFLTTKNIDMILKAININSYPQHCIDNISKTGYVFSESQIQLLNCKGYSMLSLVNAMSYKDFLSLFDNKEFLIEFTQFLENDYQYNINIKINKLKDIQTKFNIYIEETFAYEIIVRCIGPHKVLKHAINIILNIHSIAQALGMKFNTEIFKQIVKKFPVFYIATGLLTNNVVALSENDILKLEKIINFYDKPITRSFILDTLDINVFRGFVIPKFTDYDPIEDIFYILFQINENQISDFIQHLLNFRYLVYDEFLLFLMYIRPEGISSNLSLILENYIKKNGCNIKQCFIENIFTFGNVKSINLISEYKLLPDINLIKLIVNFDVIDSLNKTSIFLDDDVDKFVQKILLLSFIHAKKYTQNLIPYTTIYIDEFIDIYDSLNPKDKEIMLRIYPTDFLNVAQIIRYDITITKPMVEYMILNNLWMSLISLLYISPKYDYLIDMLDIDIISLSPSFYSRMWMLNNLINNIPNSLAISDKFFNNNKNISQDVEDIMKLPIINDLKNMHNEIEKKQENNRIDLMKYRNNFLKQEEKRRNEEVEKIKQKELYNSLIENQSEDYKTVQCITNYGENNYQPLPVNIKVAGYENDYDDDNNVEEEAEYNDRSE